MKLYAQLYNCCTSTQIKPLPSLLVHKHSTVLPRSAGVQLLMLPALAPVPALWWRLLCSCQVNHLSSIIAMLLRLAGPAGQENMPAANQNSERNAHTSLMTVAAHCLRAISATRVTASRQHVQLGVCCLLLPQDASA